MAINEERMRILRMIEQKQISAEDGAKLLAALNAGSDQAAPVDGPRNARWLRIRVTDRPSGKAKVNVNIPLGLVEVGLKMGARFAPEMAGMDVNAIQAAIREGMSGKIVEVDDEEDDERVEIFVE